MSGDPGWRSGRGARLFAGGPAAGCGCGVMAAGRRVRFSVGGGVLAAGVAMRVVARWGVAIAVSAAAFALAWWACEKLVRLDEGAALGVAGAVVAVVIAVAGWWAAQDTDSGGPDGAGRRLVQKARAGRDVNMAGRDQTVINDRLRDE
jgi:hypothetical protein